MSAVEFEISKLKQALSTIDLSKANCLACISTKKILKEVQASVYATLLETFDSSPTSADSVGAGSMDGNGSGKVRVVGLGANAEDPIRLSLALVKGENENSILCLLFSSVALFSELACSWILEPIHQPSAFSLFHASIKSGGTLKTVVNNKTKKK
jgi:hypothetical protein